MGMWKKRQGGCWEWMGIEREMHTSDTRRISLLREITLSDWRRVCQPGEGGAERQEGENVLDTVGFHILATDYNTY